MKKSYTILFLLFSLHSFAQIKFQRTYGTSAYDGAGGYPTPDGGYIMSGGIMAPPIIIQNFIMKADSLGKSIWTKTYESADTSLKSNLGAIPSKDGGYLISNYLFIGGNIGQPAHACLIKTDSNGDTIWVKRVDTGTNIYENTDGTYSMMNGEHMLWKVDSGFNNILWAKNIDGFAQAQWMEKTKDGGYIIYGDTKKYSSGGPVNNDFDLYVVKTDSAGVVQWSRAYGRSNTQEYISPNINCIQQTNDRGYIFIGATDDGLPVPAVMDILVVKTDSLGNIQWTKTYGGGQSGGGRGVSIREVGGSIGYILIGLTRGVEAPQNGNRTMLARLDGTGNIIWAKMYGSVSSNPWLQDEATLVEKAYDGGFVLSGSTESMGAGNLDGWLVKTDANGNSGCNEISTLPTISTPTLIVTMGGIDSFVAPNQITNEGPLVIGAWQLPDSLLCPLPSNPGVNEINLENMISLYPNPTGGAFQITSGELRITNIEVINVLGEKVYRLNAHTLLTHTSTIDLSYQPEGIYFVRVDTEKGIVSKKVVLLR